MHPTTHAAVQLDKCFGIMESPSSSPEMPEEKEMRLAEALLRVHREINAIQIELMDKQMMLLEACSGKRIIEKPFTYRDQIKQLLARNVECEQRLSVIIDELGGV